MKIGWRGALGFVLSALLLWYALHKVDFDEVTHVLRASNPFYFGLAAVASTLLFPLRARRWRVILDPVEPNLPFGQLWRATAIGMMVTNVVPARAGELARAYALSKEQPRVSFATAFASIAVDRVFDGVVLLLMLLVAMLDPAFPAGTRVANQPVASWAAGGIVFIIAVVGVLYAIVLFPERLIAIFESVVRRVAPRIEARGRAALLAFASGLGVLRTPGRFGAVMFWTTAHWLMNAFAFWLGFKAVGIGAPFSAALFVQGIIAIGVAVPAAPGMVGVFEAVAQVALGVYGIDTGLATAWAIGYHIVTFIPITVIGAVYFVKLGLRMDELRSAGAS
jgi:uncharacterized protein (TIRG00374 family)